MDAIRTRKAASGVRARDSTGEAPAGAFVFFDCAGPLAGNVRNWGHVGVAPGDGRMVHAWGTVRVDAIAEIPDLPGTDAWTAPRYAASAAPGRIVTCAVEQSWGET